MSSRKMQRINSFSRRWSKPGPAELLEVEVAGKLASSCPYKPPQALCCQVPPHTDLRQSRQGANGNLLTKPAPPSPSPSHSCWASWSFQEVWVGPSRRYGLVLPGGVGRNKTRSFCSGARLRIAIYPYFCSTWVCPFKVLTPFFYAFFFCSTVALLLRT